MAAQKLEQSVPKRFLKHYRVRCSVERDELTIREYSTRQDERMDVGMRIEERTYAVDVGKLLET